jgi:hypothetical protein
MNSLEHKGITFENLGNGIYVYSNVLPTSLDIINRLEKILSEDDKRYSWQPAYVSRSYARI